MPKVSAVPGSPQSSTSTVNSSVVVAVGRGFHWWQAVLLCHGAAVASFVTILFLSPGWPGVAGGAVAASGWTAAGLVAGICCAARGWIARPRARLAG